MSVRRRFRLVLKTLVPVVAVTGVLTVATLQADYRPTPRQAWTVEGLVYDAAQAGNVLYLAGDFTAAAPTANAAGRFVQLRTSGSATPVSTPMPSFNGPVHAVVADGAGGHYVGGFFTEAGGVGRQNFAHVRADGTLGPLAPAFDNYVGALHLAGNVLYVGGGFAQAAGSPRNAIAAIDVTTGALLAWNPALSANADVTAIESRGLLVYLGGAFSSVGGVSRSNLAAVNVSSGAVATLFTANVNSIVHALHYADSALFVGGQFSTVNGTARAGLAKVHALTGALQAFDASVGASVGSASVMALQSDGTSLYFGGSFATAGGQARFNLAAADLVTGVTRPFAPAIRGHVDALRLSGSTLYVGGDFSCVVDEPRANLAAVTTAGALLPWNPGVSAPVYGIAATGAAVTVVGRFQFYGAVVREGLAALDLTTGELTSFAPSLERNGSKGRAIDLDVAGGSLYVAGGFTSVNGAPRHNLAAFSVSDGALTSWSPAADAVIALKVTGAQVFLGGAFSAVNGTTRAGLAAVDAVTGALLPFAPTVTGVVQSLELADGTLYAGGSFTQVNGQNRPNLAAFNVATGAMTSFNPSVTGGIVLRLKATPTELYLAGTFSAVGGQPRTGVAAVSRTTSAPLPFAPVLVPPSGFSLTVFDIDLDDTTAYIGGVIQSANGQPRRGLAAVDRATGVTTRPFDPPAGRLSAWVVRVTPALLLAHYGMDAPVPLALFPRSAMGGAPGRPSTPVATVQNGNAFTMSWAAAPVGGEPTSYLVEASTVPGATTIGSLPAATSTFSYANVPPGLYYLRVRAQNAFGVSPPSGEIAVLFGNPDCGAPPLRPDTLASVNGSTVSLSWAESVGSAGTYRLGAGSAAGLSNLADIGTGAARTFTALAPPGMYYVRTTADSACGRSAPGPDTLVSVGGVLPPVAPVVTGSVTGNSVALTWAPTSGATGYVVEAGSGPLQANVATVPVGFAGLGVNGVPSGTYYVRVRALTAAGWSPASNEVVLVVP